MPTERTKNRALPTLSTRATGDGPLKLARDSPQLTQAGDGPLKLARDSPQLTQALPDVRKVTPCQLIDVAAGQCGIVGQRQETSDLLQAEAKLATTRDEPQPVHLLW